MSELLHESLFERIPIVGGVTRSKLEGFAGQCVMNENAPSVSIIIRAYNERDSLVALLDDLEEQVGVNEAQIIVVDNESSDGTTDVARARADEVVTIPRGEFTYPKSMNLGVEAADNPVAYLTVGHARLTSTKTLIAARNSFIDTQVGGVFAATLPNSNASNTERAFSALSPLLIGKTRKVKRAGMGVLGATSAAVNKSIWEELDKFDERYESGGEDTALAKKMLESGYKVEFNPLLTVHHTHGLGVADSYRQWRQWSNTLKGPVPLDLAALKKRRPDIKG